MKKKLLSNWGLKLASVVLAFILWIVVVRIEDPQETRTIRNVPVKLINTSLLTDENKVYEVLEDTDVIRGVTILAKKTVLDQLSSGDVMAVADVKNLVSYSNTIEISITVPQYGDQVDKITATNNILKLNVEDKKSKWVGLKANVTGQVAKGYMIGNVSLDQNSIQITGPESQVDSVSYAGVDVAVTDFTTNLSANMEIKLYDENDQPLELKSVEKTAEYTHINVEVLAVKEVPVVLTAMGEPADGYMATGVIDSDRPALRIAGSSAALNNVTAITIPEEELDLTGATGNLEKVINLKEYLPEGIRLAESGFNGRINVTVYVEATKEKTLAISREHITLLHAPADFDVDYADDTESYQLKVEGLAAQIDLLTENSLRGTVDIAAWMEESELAEMTPGTRILPVEFGLAEDIMIKQPVAVKLVFTKKEAEQ